ncbi:hypothetical protein ACFLQR_05510, partial [Verrucomicrobiota bacterium]
MEPVLEGVTAGLPHEKQQEKRRMNDRRSLIGVWGCMGVVLLTAGLSGAATYEVGTGQAYTNIQDALDQLSTDVSTNAFTEAQVINVHAGTYNEQVEPATGLNPTETY